MKFTDSVDPDWKPVNLLVIKAAVACSATLDKPPVLYLESGPIFK